jgi:two-component system chemotaxis sensor kinase CheA
MDASPYLGLFLSESREHLTSAYDLLLRLEQQPDDGEALQALMRHAHSLKGMGATLGYASIVELAHALEDEFERLRATARVVSRASLALLQDAMARLGGIIDHIERGGGGDDAQAEALAAELRRLASGPAIDADNSELVSPVQQRESSTGEEERVAIRYRVDLVFSPSTALHAERTVAALNRLGRLGRVRRVSPPRLSGDPPRFEGALSLVLDYPAGTGKLSAELQGIEEVESFRVAPEATREPAVATDGEVTRWARVRADLLDSVVERGLDLIAEQGQLREAARSGENLGERLDRTEVLLKELFAAVTELRLLPFSSIAHRLHQTVRELTRKLGRRVRFRIAGGDVWLDRALLDSLVDPLRHMVCNALDHGIEPPRERDAAGKPVQGTLTLELERRGESVSIALEDDGRGLHAETLRRIAVERGFMPETRARTLTDAEAFQLITLPAFSTAQRLSGVSGRGVGMDVVREAVESLGGRLLIRSRPGEGTRLELSLPVNQALIQALLLRCCGELFAMPISPLRRALDLDHARLRANADRQASRSANEPLRLLYLDEQLGLAAGRRRKSRRRGSVLVLNLDGRDVGLVVEEILGRRELVVKPLQAPLDQMKRYAGAAVLEEGAVALVLDPYHLCSD